MLLAVDIGNTNITLGLYEGERLRDAWRLATVHDRMPDEYGLQLLGLLEHAGCGRDEIDAVALASVVPPLTGTFVEACEKYLRVPPFVVDAGVKTGLKIRYEDPKHALGADRVVDAVAVLRLYGGPACVVDFGTATTFDAISADGEYLGGATLRESASPRMLSSCAPRSCLASIWEDRRASSAGIRCTPFSRASYTVTWALWREWWRASARSWESP